MNVEPASVVRAVLIDDDPISRHVLSAMLGQDDKFELMAAAGRPEDVRQWGPERVDVVVLCSPLNQDVFSRVREFAERGLHMLLVSTGWTRQSVDAALAAGVAGCIVKNAKIETIATIAAAVSSGHLVISPELRPFLPPHAAEPRRADRLRSGALAPEELVRSLTDREHEVLSLLAAGRTTAETATELGVSRATVKSHVSHSLTKLGARNRVEAVLMVREVASR